MVRVAPPACLPGGALKPFSLLCSSGSREEAGPEEECDFLSLYLDNIYAKKCEAADIEQAEQEGLQRRTEFRDWADFFTFCSEIGGENPSCQL